MVNAKERKELIELVRWNFEETYYSCIDLQIMYIYLLMKEKTNK